jgi:primosomal protein N' (replication factor Y)
MNWFSMYNIIAKGKVLKMCVGDIKNMLKEVKLTHKVINLSKNNYILNKEQKNALSDLNKLNDNYSVSVLQGITGSGKTIVYFERIKKYLIKNRQVLVLLPEISLTDQFKDRFLDFFGFEPAIWHSKITPKNKRIIWQGIINNKIKLVIGARSSLLLPFKKLGLIVVDEEHDPSYKQDENPIYNARDMAIARASIEDIPIHLVTSIPSLETYNHIKNKKYKVVKILKRFNNYPLPETKIVNLNLKKLKNKFIASETIEIVKKYLQNNDQILFFLNRRGYAPFLVCKVCGYKHICPDCSIYLTYHKSINKLICHHCGHKSKYEKKCLNKKNFCSFSMYGPGVEKISEELKILFPEKKIKIFSSDYLKKDESIDIIKKISNNEINILIGTQMISKGFNFPKLNCIVVVDADFSGKGYDLRTTEKNIQLYNQLSGRAGRFSEKSIIIYQTLAPENETLKNLIKNNPEHFLSNELILRKENKLPPFQRLIALIVSSKSKENSFRGAQEIKNKLKIIQEMDIMGPVESPIARVKKMFRTRLLLRSKSQALIQKKLVKTLDSLKISPKIKLTVDVDPINFT